MHQPGEVLLQVWKDQSSARAWRLVVMLVGAARVRRGVMARKVVQVRSFIVRGGDG